MKYLNVKIGSIWQCKDNPFDMIRIESAPYCKLQYLYGEKDKYGFYYPPKSEDETPTRIVADRHNHAFYLTSSVLLPQRTIVKYHKGTIPTYKSAIQASLLDLYYKQIHEPN
jgi:hypothetical protein